MKPYYLRPTAVVLLVLMTCASCSTAERRLTSAASELGRSRARVTLPDLPEDCRKQELHAALVEGGEARSILLRERGALDRQNARAGRCAAFYDDAKGRLEHGS